MDFDILNRVTLLIARRNSGKSVLLKKLVGDSMHKFSKIFVICPSEPVNHFYKNSGLVSDDCIFENYSEKWGNALLKKMGEINEGKTKENAKQILVIIDDGICDIDFRTSPSLRKLFIRGRHLSIALIITSQNLCSLSPLERNNADYILCGQLSAKSLDVLTDDYCPASIPKKDFINYYSKSTLNYGFIVINNNSTKTNDKNEVLGVLRVSEEDI